MESKLRDGSKLTIRKVMVRDAPQLLNVFNSLVDESDSGAVYFTTVYTKLTLDKEKVFLKSYVKDMKAGKKTMLVAIVDGKIVGNGYVERKGGRASHVGEIGYQVISTQRGRGIGTKLLKAIMIEGKKMKLKSLISYVISTNTSSIRLLKKNGFKKTGKWQKYVLVGRKYVDYMMLQKLF